MYRSKLAMIKKSTINKALSVLLILAIAAMMLTGILEFAIALPGEMWNLSNFIVSGGITIYDSSNTVVPPGGTVVNGDQYTIIIEFAEGAGNQFDYAGHGWLEYTIPSNLELLTNITNGEIALGALYSYLHVGHYTADKSTGTFKVYFDEVDNSGTATPGRPYFDNYTDTKFMLELEAVFQEGAGDIYLDFGESYTLSFKIEDPEPGITVSKPPVTLSGGKLDYRVEITATGYAAASPAQEITDIVLRDAPFTRTSATGTKTPITAGSEGAYSDFEYTIIRADGTTSPAFTMSIPTSWPTVLGRRGFEYEFTGVTLNPGDSIVVSYSFDLNDFLTLSNRYPTYSEFYIGNDVEVTATGGLSDTATTQNRIPGSSTFISKTYDSPGYSDLWRAYVGNGNITLNGMRITDTQTSDDVAYPMSFPEATDITVILYATTTSLFTSPDPDLTFTADDLITAGFLTISGNKMTFIVPPATDTSLLGTALGDIYRVEFIYDTDEVIGIPPVAWPDTRTTVTHTNTIAINTSPIQSDDAIRIFTGGQTGIPGAPTGTITVAKSSSGIQETASGEYEIEYTITIFVQGGNEGRSLYIRDELTVLGGTTYYINNDPDPPTVTITGESGSLPVHFNSFTTGNNRRYWDIYFDNGLPGTGTTANNSVWPYTTDKTITITYTLELDSRSFGASSNGTIEELLKRDVNAYLRNIASVLNVVDSTKNVSDLVDDEWPIFKTAVAVTGDPSTFNYTVTLNRYGLHALFDSTPAIFTDEFDSLLMYVPGSFYVMSDGNKYVLDNESSLIASTPPTRTLTVDLRDLVEDGGGLTDPLWYTREQRIDIHYQLRVPNPGRQPPGTTNSLSNTATIESTTLSIEFSDTATVSFRNDIVTKALNTDGSTVASVEIIINPNGWKIAPTGVDSFTATDTMSSNLSFFLGSIFVETQTKLPSGVWDGTWVPQDENAGDPWTLSYNLGANQIIFEFPDEKPIRITYDVRVLMAPGEPDDIWNEIILAGIASVKNERNFEVQGTYGSASGDKVTLNLNKSDEDDNSIGLADAEFELYMAIPSGGYYDQCASSPTNLITVDTLNFYLLMTETTNSSGIAVFASDWMTPTHGAVFMLVETIAPDGYEQPVAPDNRTFFVLGAANALSTVMSVSVNVIDTDHIMIENTIIPVVVTTSPSPSPSSSPSPSPSPSPRPMTSPTPRVTETPTATPTETPTARPTDTPEPSTRDVYPAFEDDSGGDDDALFLDDRPIPTAPQNYLEQDGDGWLELDEFGVPLGRWSWDPDEEMWLFDPFPPLGSLPQTGVWGARALLFFILGLILSGTGVFMLKRVDTM